MSDAPVDPRVYHDDANQPESGQYDPKPYWLINRRFPQGVAVRRYYSLNGCVASVVRLADGETAYVMPEELHSLI